MTSSLGMLARGMDICESASMMIKWQNRCTRTKAKQRISAWSTDVIAPHTLKKTEKGSTRSAYGYYRGTIREKQQSLLSRGILVVSGFFVLGLERF